MAVPVGNLRDTIGIQQLRLWAGRGAGNAAGARRMLHSHQIVRLMGMPGAPSVPPGA